MTCDCKTALCTIVHHAVKIQYMLSLIIWYFLFTWLYLFPSPSSRPWEIGLKLIALASASKLRPLFRPQPHSSGLGLGLGLEILASLAMWMQLLELIQQTTSQLDHSLLATPMTTLPSSFFLQSESSLHSWFSFDASASIVKHRFLMTGHQDRNWPHTSSADRQDFLPNSWSLWGSVKHGSYTGRYWAWASLEHHKMKEGWWSQVSVWCRPIYQLTLDKQD